MTNAIFTRSIAINAPVHEVFGFISDPVRLFATWPMTVSVSDVRLAPEGVGTTYAWDGGSEWGLSLSGTMTREVHLPEERMVERSSTRSVWDWTLRPEGEGTRLTVTCDHSARSMMDGVEVTVMRMQARDLEQMLATIKEGVERR